MPAARHRSARPGRARPGRRHRPPSRACARAVGGRRPARSRATGRAGRQQGRREPLADRGHPTGGGRRRRRMRWRVPAPRRRHGECRRQARRPLLAAARERRANGDLPRIPDEPAWTIEVTGAEPALEWMHDSWLAMVDGVIGTQGSPLAAYPPARREVIVGGVYSGIGPATDALRVPDWTRLAGQLTSRGADPARPRPAHRASSTTRRTSSAGRFRADHVREPGRRPGSASFAPRAAVRARRADGPLAIQTGARHRVGRGRGGRHASAMLADTRRSWGSRVSPAASRSPLATRPPGAVRHGASTGWPPTASATTAGRPPSAASRMLRTRGA